MGIKDGLGGSFPKEVEESPEEWLKPNCPNCVKTRWTLAILVCVGLIVGFATQALAHHQKGHNVFIRGEIGQSFLPLCDTQEQSTEIIQAILDGGMPAGIAKYTEYFHTRSPRAGSTCLMGELARRGVHVVIIHERVAKFLNVPDGEGGKETMYVVRVFFLSDEKRIPYYLVSSWDVITKEEDKKRTDKSSWQKI